MMNKIYCYADESGQDTGGKSFFVAVIIIQKDFQEEIIAKLLEAETISRKRKRKWGEINKEIRTVFLEKLAKIIKNKGHIYYAVFHQTKEFIALTAFTIAQSILIFGAKDTESTIIIDGLKETEKGKILEIIKNFQIHYNKIRGLNDKSDPVLRLADSIAGLVRDVDEKQENAGKLLDSLAQRQIISQIQK